MAVHKTLKPETRRSRFRFNLKTMFCPSCGVEYTVELKYCNRCGANLNTLVTPQPAPVVVNVTKPILIISLLLSLITLGGMGALVGGATALAPIVHNNDPLIAMMLMGMITILVVDVSVIRLLSKIITSALSSASPPQLAPPFMSHQPIAQLQSPSTTERLQGAPSVTENTTRFFEPYRSGAEQQTEVRARKIES